MLDELVGARRGTGSTSACPHPGEDRDDRVRAADHPTDADADAVETARVPVRAVAGGTLGGAAVGVLAAADERVASASCVIALTEPRVVVVEGRAGDLEVAARRAHR